MATWQKLVSSVSVKASRRFELGASVCCVRRVSALLMGELHVGGQGLFLSAKQPIEFDIRLLAAGLILDE